MVSDVFMGRACRSTVACLVYNDVMMSSRLRRPDVHLQGGLRLGSLSDAMWEDTPTGAALMDLADIFSGDDGGASL